MNEKAKIKKKLEKIEKRAPTEQPVKQPRNVPPAAVIPKFSEAVKTPQGMTIEEVVEAQTVELAKIRAQVDNKAEHGQTSNDVGNEGSRLLMMSEMKAPDL